MKKFRGTPRLFLDWPSLLRTNFVKLRCMGFLDDASFRQTRYNSNFGAIEFPDLFFVKNEMVEITSIVTQKSFFRKQVPVLRSEENCSKYKNFATFVNSHSDFFAVDALQY